MSTSIVSDSADASRDVFDTAQAAAFIGVAATSLEVDRCRRRWKIPHYKIGRLVTYRRADLEAFLARCRVEG